jgi:Ca2+-transporting ATPase
LPQKAGRSAFALLLSQFHGFMFWLLVGAGALSFVVKEWIDGVAILSIVLLNGFIGFKQEYSAERAMEALRGLTAPRARVRRDGASKVVPAREVVVGDLILLEPGDVVPADARLVEAHSLELVESALTGESEPVAKDTAPIAGPTSAVIAIGERTNMVHLGTAVAAGTAVGVVVATGAATETGRIATLLQQVAADDVTPLEGKLRRVGRMLVNVALLLVALVFAIGLLRGLPTLELLLATVGLAVAAIPEGLPTVVTIALAIGIQRMARRGALVRRMHAVETLGQASVVCCDKTGTLTEGSMSVERYHTASGSFAVGREPSHESEHRDLLQALAGCNDAEIRERRDGGFDTIGDPTETALLVAAARDHVTRAAIEAEHPRLAELPFDSSRKRMTVIRRAGPRVIAFVKGAPDGLVERCSRIAHHGGERAMDDSDRAAIGAAQRAFSLEALRVLAAARRGFEAPPDPHAPPDEVERDLVFLGLVAMRDPPRKSARTAVAAAQAAGIRVAMITGDHPATAEVIAHDLGIAREGDLVVTGQQIEQATDLELDADTERVAVYARVTPEHKLRIVRSWQRLGAVVAMTGDGVNDAPAIRGADIGIAMGRSGTEVAKEAADIVLTDDDFATIVAAVEEGRGIYDNIKKTLHFLLAGNCGELIFMTASVAAGLPLPLAPVHLLWINLVTDGLPTCCAARRGGATNRSPTALSSARSR